jgi:hypothetical protein
MNYLYDKNMLPKCLNKYINKKIKYTKSINKLQNLSFEQIITLKTNNKYDYDVINYTKNYVIFCTKDKINQDKIKNNYLNKLLFIINQDT